MTPAERDYAGCCYDEVLRELAACGAEVGAGREDYGEFTGFRAIAQVGMYQAGLALVWTYVPHASPVCAGTPACMVLALLGGGPVPSGQLAVGPRAGFWAELQVMTGLRVVPAQAGILETLAEIAAQAGECSTARSRYQEALALLPPGHPREPAIRGALTALPDPGGGR